MVAIDSFPLHVRPQASPAENRAVVAEARAPCSSKASLTGPIFTCVRQGTSASQTQACRRPRKSPCRGNKQKVGFRPPHESPTKTGAAPRLVYAANMAKTTELPSMSQLTKTGADCRSQTAALQFRCGEQVPLSASSLFRWSAYPSECVLRLMRGELHLLQMTLATALVCGDCRKFACRSFNP